MKAKSILEFTITIVVKFALPIISLDPVRDIGADWKFEEDIHGPADNDGISAFKDALVNAAALVAQGKKQEAYELLFATGLADGQKVITGDDRIKVLIAEKLADPDLGWSLYKEEGQKTLRYLHDTFGVEWMEFLRRVLCDPNGGRRSLYLCRKDDGSWDWRYNWLGGDRLADFVALVLGK